MTQDRSNWKWWAAALFFIAALIALDANLGGIAALASGGYLALLQALSSPGGMPPPFAAHWAAPFRFMATLISAGGTGAILLALMLRGKRNITLFFATAILLFAFAFSLALYAQYNIFCDISIYLLSLCAGALGAVAGSWASHKKQYFQLLRCFRSRLSKKQIHAIARAPERVRFNGEQRMVSTLVCMLRTLPHKDTRAEPYISSSQAALPHITDIILHHGGLMEPSVNGFSAYWNMPLDDPRHACHACAAALAILSWLESYNARSGRPPIRVGMSLTAGEGVSGAYMFGQAPHYTIRSFSAGIGVYIERLTEIYDVPILTCHRMRTLVGEQFAMLPVDYRTLPPSTVPVPLYALIGDAGTRTSPTFRALETLHNQNAKMILRQDWDGVRAGIAHCRKLSGAIPALYDLYEQRIDYLEKYPPPKDWDGCFRVPLL